MRVVGIISEDDLSVCERALPFSEIKLLHLFGQWIEPAQIMGVYQRVRHYTAADVMTLEAACVDANEEIGNVALFMIQRRLKGVPVLRKGRLVGFISQLDLIRPLANMS
jgi:CBS domain-containing protein